MDEKQLVRVVHERPALDLERSMRDVSWRVIAWMFVALPGVLLLVLTVGVRLSDFVASVVVLVGFTMAAGGVWGCVVSIASFYEVRNETVYMERQYWPSEVRDGTISLERRTGNKIEIGKYRLHASELDSLAQVLHGNDWRFVRDVVRQAGVFKGINKAKQWAEVSGEFVRMGIVKDRVVLPEMRYVFTDYSPTLRHVYADY